MPTLYVVATPIGNLEDISLRALRILREVKLIAAEDTRKTRRLLTANDIRTPMTSYYEHNKLTKLDYIIGCLEEGDVALVSEAGTPGISDPAYVLVQAALENNIRIIPIPGASAFLASLTVSGLPVNRFVFEGFLPIKKGRKSKIEALSGEKRTIVFYESPYRILKTVQQLLTGWGNRRCVMGREITKKFEEFYRGGLADLLAYLEKKPVKGEIVLIVAGAGNNFKAD